MVFFFHEDVQTRHHPDRSRMRVDPCGGIRSLVTRVSEDSVGQALRAVDLVG